MGSMADRQISGFSQRLQRINAGGPNTTGTIYMGSMDSDGIAIDARTRKARNTSRAGSLVLLIFALLAGAASMFAGRIGTFQLLQHPDLVPAGYGPWIPLVADIAIAATLMLLLAFVFRLGHGMRRVFLMLGFLSVMMGESLIIQQAPDLFVPVFSESYVTAAMSETAPIQTVQVTLDAFAGSQLVMPAGLLPGV